MNKSKKHWFLKVTIIFLLCSCILVGYKIYRPIPDTTPQLNQKLSLQERIKFQKGLYINLTTQDLTSYINEALEKKEQNFRINIQKNVIIDGKQDFIGRPLDYQLKLKPMLNEQNKLILIPESLYIGAVKVPNFLVTFLINHLQVELPTFIQIKNNQIVIDISQINLSPYFSLNLTNINLDKNLVSVQVKLKGIN